MPQVGEHTGLGIANDRLNGWKEISAYLGKSVRTVQRWERTLGLPVRRISTQGGEIIFALRSEVSDWLLRQDTEVSQDPPVSESPGELDSCEVGVESSNADVIPEQNSGWHFGGVHRSRAVWALATTLAVAVLVLVFNLHGHGKPNSFDVQGKALIVRDEAGKTLWVHSFEEPLAPPSHFVRHKMFWTGDIDNDGHTEVLFAFASAQYGHPGLLYCFSDSGKLRWTFSPGKKVRTATEEFGNIFVIESLIVVDTPRGKRVVVSGLHYPYYPEQLAVLDPNGELLSEYWHSGHLFIVEALDREGDGSPEIVGVGIDNNFKQATLVMLNIENMTGASYEPNPKYQLLDMPLAHEQARILFPRSCINKATFEYSVPTELSVSPGLISVHLRESYPGSEAVVYQFDYNLRLRSFSPTAGFTALHREMYARGELDHPYGDRDEPKDADITRLGPWDSERLSAHSGH